MNEQEYYYSTMLRDLIGRQTLCLQDYTIADHNILDVLLERRPIPFATSEGTKSPRVTRSNPPTPTSGGSSDILASTGSATLVSQSSLIIPEGEGTREKSDQLSSLPAQKSADSVLQSADVGCQTGSLRKSGRGAFLLRRSWRRSHFRSKSQGERPEKKEHDSNSSLSRVEMVPETAGGGPLSAVESASQAAQEILISSPGSSKARQKKFHRHFKTVPPDEKVLNYYSCALVADILLQGHLYITRNYFAFYSNVFGYVTKLLIPTSSVLKVTKEKTAFIIPNAVGVRTEEEKHVFGSLLSRDSTYKLMVQVWNAALAPPTPPVGTAKQSEMLEGGGGLSEMQASGGLEAAGGGGCGPPTGGGSGLTHQHQQHHQHQDDESSLSGSESNLVSSNLQLSPKSSSIVSTASPPPSSSSLPQVTDDTQKMAQELKSYQDMFSQTTVSSGSGIAAETKLRHSSSLFAFLKELPRPTLLLLISTGLLILLFLSAAVLLFRIARLHQPPVDFSTRSMNEVHAYINNNLEHISKVRESLEKLSFLIENSGKYHQS